MKKGKFFILLIIELQIVLLLCVYLLYRDIKQEMSLPNSVTNISTTESDKRTNNSGNDARYGYEDNSAAIDKQKK